MGHERPSTIQQSLNNTIALEEERRTLTLEEILYKGLKDRVEEKDLNNIIEEEILANDV